MNAIFDPVFVEFATRLFIALSLGMLIGVEREMAGKGAGMRTYALVSMGSALFVAVSVMAVEQFGGSAVVDPLRIPAQIVSGIGFLGAGLIIFKERLEGLTTAAGLWVAAGIGMAAGFGFTALAVISTVFTIFVFTALWFISSKVKTAYNHDASHEDHYHRMD